MKYEPLKRYLEAIGEAAVPLSFEEIEQILGAPLPASARKYAAWWANSPSNHVNAKAWLGAGYVSERVDLRGERLVFARRTGSVAQAAPGLGEADAKRLPPPGLVERLRARLGGTVWVAPGVDLTAPTGEVWNAERE
jgi:hypothetical protein